MNIAKIFALTLFIGLQYCLNNGQAARIPRPADYELNEVVSPAQVHQFLNTYIRELSSDVELSRSALVDQMNKLFAEYNKRASLMEPGTPELMNLNVTFIGHLIKIVKKVLPFMQSSIEVADPRTMNLNVGFIKHILKIAKHILPFMDSDIEVGNGHY